MARHRNREAGLLPAPRNLTGRPSPPPPSRSLRSPADPRYFPLKLPIAGSGTTTTFVYADPSGRRRLQSDRIRAWVAAHAALWDALGDGGGAVHVVAVTRTEDAAAANAAILETWRGPPAPPVVRSETDQQLIDEVELVRTTDNVRPLDKYGGVIKAVKAYRRILDRERAAHGPARYIDAYSTHIAERLTPDRLAG